MEPMMNAIIKARTKRKPLLVLVEKAFEKSIRLRVRVRV